MRTMGSKRILSLALALLLAAMCLPVGAFAESTEKIQQESYGLSGPERMPTADGVGHTVTTKLMLNGKPVADTEVWMITRDSGHEEYSSVSDSNGVVTFVGVNERQYHFFVDNTDEYATYSGRYKDAVFSIPGEVPDIILDPGFTVTSSVTMDGVPLPGVGVTVFNDTYEGWATSDENGNLSFRVPKGTGYFFAIQYNDELPIYYGSDLNKYFSVSENNSVPVKAPSIEYFSQKTISTTVTYNGAPQADVRVNLYLGRDLMRSAVTDANGVVSFGDITFTDNKLCYFKIDSNGDYANYNGRAKGKTFRILDGQIPNIELERGTSFTTRVYLDNIPCGNVQVTLYYPDYSDSYTQTSDSNGYVSFSNLPSTTGSCYFFVRGKGAFADYHGEYHAPFSIPGQIPDIHLETGNTITTKITLNGNPVENANILVLSSWDFVSEDVASDSNGNITVPNVPTGSDFFFFVHSEDGKYTFYNGLAEGKTFSTASGTVPPIELTQGNSISTKVTLRGVPVAGQEIELSHTIYETSYLSAGTAKTDDSGTATFTNINPSYLYEFEIWNLGYFSDAFRPSRGVPNIELDPTYKPGGSSSSTSSSGSSSGGTSKSDQQLAAERASQSTVQSTSPLAQSEAASLAKSAVEAARASGADSADIKVRNRGGISLAALKAMATTDGLPVRLLADTINDAGQVEVRLILNPTAAVKSLQLGASTTSSGAASVSRHFNKYFSNTITVVELEQQDSFGLPVEICIKPAVGMTPADLCFYRYDKAANSYRQITVENCWMDSAGYLHFSTSEGGSIVISQGALAKR